MGRYCSECGDWATCSQFSRNQWSKGDGYSRCRDCVDYENSGGYEYVAPASVFQCGECYREFNNQNELNMHLQVHRPRNVACPICGDRRFRSGANAVQHVESGYCSGCYGRDNARQQNYNFARSQPNMRHFMNNNPPPMLTWSNENFNTGDDFIPEFPYHCPQCSMCFRQMGQLLQHQDNRHNNHARVMINY